MCFSPPQHHLPGELPHSRLSPANNPATAPLSTLIIIIIIIIIIALLSSSSSSSLPGSLGKSLEGANKLLLEKGMFLKKCFRLIVIKCFLIPKIMLMEPFILSRIQWSQTFALQPRFFYSHFMSQVLKLTGQACSLAESDHVTWLLASDWLRMSSLHSSDDTEICPMC